MTMRPWNRATTEHSFGLACARGVVSVLGDEILLAICKYIRLLSRLCSAEMQVNRTTAGQLLLLCQVLSYWDCWLDMLSLFLEATSQTAKPSGLMHCTSISTACPHTRL
jgi:hypothetical protein